jgi:hypothetical protein
MHHQALIERIKAEFLEMPGLRLNVAQAQRLYGVEQALCQAILNTLVDAGFLRVNTDGTYTRLSEGRDGADRARAGDDVDKRAS